jgi:HPt (histidine-containing phosphotransfer) domain-containing protein
MILRMKGETPGADPQVDQLDPERLDLRRLEDLRSLGDLTGQPLLFEVLETFLADFPRQLEKMREALARADARDLALVAHGLKGSSAQLGLTRVSALSFEVERGAGADLSLVPSLLSALASELARVAPLLAERQEREGLRREITPLSGGGESGPPTPRR